MGTDTCATNNHNTFCESHPSEIYVDAHMHVQSGRCMPLPSLWVMNSSIENDSREEINKLMGGESLIPDYFTKKYHAITAVQTGSTYQIGTDALSEINSFKDNRAFDPTVASTKTAITTIMMMDLEFAHYEGYEGTKIYTMEDKTRKALFNQKEVEDEIFRKLGDPIEKGTYDKWEIQLEESELLGTQNPFNFFVMYHFDPRRLVQQGSAGDLVKNLIKNKIVLDDKPGLHIGFKVYPPLGFRPYDDRLKDILEAFYSQCQDKAIPILTHCSNGGTRAFNWNAYFPEDSKKKYKSGNNEHYIKSEYLKKHVHPQNWRPVLEKFKDLKLCLAHFGGSAWDKTDPGRPDKPSAPLKKPGDFSFGEKAWTKNAEYNKAVADGHKYEKDMEKYKKDMEKFKEYLEAQSWITEIYNFVRNYKNVYTDLSYWVFDGELDEHKVNRIEAFKKILLLDKAGKGQAKNLVDGILFGTDWYMTLLDQYNYGQMASNAKTAIDAISLQVYPEKPKNFLWKKFSLTNPMEFYGLTDLKNRPDMNELKTGTKLARMKEGITARMKGFLKNNYKGTIYKAIVEDQKSIIEGEIEKNFQLVWCSLRKIETDARTQ